jgi:hypothetical protein
MTSHEKGAVVDSKTTGRRKALKTLVLGGLGAATLPVWIDRLTDVALAHSHHAASPSAAAAQWSPAILMPHQNETVAAISELMIPQTKTAGAKAANVNQFIDAVIADSEVRERDQFLRGLEWIDARSRELYGGPFTSATPQQQSELLTLISASADKTPADQLGVEFFRAIKILTITGYYTSKIGMQQELGDDLRVVFPDYVGCTHPEHGAGPPSAGARAAQRP